MRFRLRGLLVLLTVCCITAWWFWTRPMEFAKRQTATGQQQIDERDRTYSETAFDQRVNESLVTILGDSRLTHWDDLQWLAAPDSDSIVSYGSDGALLMWRRDDGSIEYGFYDVQAAAYAAERQQVLFIDGQGQLRSWSTDNPDDASVQPATSLLPDNWQGRLASSPDGRYLVRLDRWGAAAIWSCESERIVKEVPNQTNMQMLLSAIAFHPSSDSVLLGVTHHNRFSLLRDVTGRLR